MTPTQEWLARGRVPFIRHFTATTQIDVLDETHAKARSYYLFLTVHGLDHWGRYLDEFAPVDGKWLITHRREMTDAAFAGGWGAGLRGPLEATRGRAPHPATVVLTPGSLRTMTATVGTPSDVDALLDAPLAELMARRRGLPRRRARRPHHLLAQGVHPAHDAVPRPLRLLHVRQAARARSTRRTSTLDEVLAIARRGAELGCHEALFTLGEAPEDRYPQAAEWLAAHGYASTVDYLVAAARRGARRDRPAPPRQRRRARPRPSSSGCGRCSPSQGMMIETLAARLGEPGGPHSGAPDKTPERRLATLEAAGRARVPFTTGILVGIGETPRRAASTRSLAIARRARAPRPRAGGDRPELPAQAGHRDARAPAVPARRVPLDDRGRARLVLGPTMHLQAPPNLPSRRPRARCSPPASTTGAASRRSRPTT